MGQPIVCLHYELCSMSTSCEVSKQLELAIVMFTLVMLMFG